MEAFTKKKRVWSEYDEQAKKFYEGFGFEIEYSGGTWEPPEWVEPGQVHGRRYWVTISRVAKGYTPLCFAYWGSRADADNGLGPSFYDILACVASDSHYDMAFEEWCSELGYDTDSRKAYATWERCREFAKKICAFFTADELEALREIQ